MSDKTTTTIVSLHGISKSFPGVRALDDVNLEVSEGEVLGLVGKNGAGKSTLVKVLMGIHEPDIGTIEIGGQSLSKISATEAQNAGIAYVPQHVAMMESLTVAENVLTGNLPRGALGLVSWDKVYKEAEERLQKLGLDLDVRKNVEGLSVAENTMLAIAQALFRDARLIILDEPTASLSSTEIDLLFNFLRSLKKQGVGIVFISHHLEEVFEVGDRVTVLRDGQEVGTHRVDDLDMKKLTHLIVGENVNEYTRSSDIPLGEVVLEIKGLTRRGFYEDININARRGEIIGISGLQGSGAAHLAAGLFGLERRGIGEVKVKGTEYNAQNPREAFIQDVAMLPQDRHRLGLVGVRTLKENISYSIVDRLSGLFTFLDLGKEQQIVNDFVENLGIVTPSIDQSVRLLSGGNQQKVVFAKLAASGPSVLILHEPTQGIDVRAKLDIYRVIDNLSQEGIAVLIISSEVRELVGVCNRILIMYQGKITKEFKKDDPETTPSNLLMAIEGGTSE